MRGRQESPEIRKGKVMIRLQDIADMAGVSRTTVSNVLHGNTKRVSQETVDKIKKILEESGYQPNIGSMMLTGKGSRIIGFVIGYTYTHGHPSMMDPFVSALLASIQDRAEKAGYYIMIIGGSEEKHILEIASRWNDLHWLLGGPLPPAAPQTEQESRAGRYLHAAERIRLSECWN